MRTRRAIATAWIAAAAAACLGTDLPAQDERPEPAPPPPQEPDAPPQELPPAGLDEWRPAPRAAVPISGAIDWAENSGGGRATRRPANGEKVMLGFKDVAIEATMPLIVQATGKVVMPASTTTTSALMQKKVTVYNDEPVDYQDALDYLFSAFRMNGVGVVETDDRVILVLLTEVAITPAPVIGPDETILGRSDTGVIVTKIYALQNASAEQVGEHVRGSVSEDTALLAVDTNSNQIMLTAPIEICQRVQQIIAALDREWVRVRTATFRLAHADASEVAQNIMEIFEDARAPGAAAAGAQAQAGRAMTPAQRQRLRDAQRAGQTTPADGGTPGAVVELRVTVNTAQNSVTVSAAERIVDQITQLIETQWDLPRSKATQKVYHLKYTDPIKMRDMLQELLGGGTGAAGARRAPAGGTAAAGRGDVSDVVSGIYQIQAYEDSTALVVICKTEESFEFLDALIEDLDQPVFPMLPIVVELKHANAELVADTVNVILAPSGARVELPRQQTGLRGIDVGGGLTESETGIAGSTGETGTGGTTTEAGTMTFPWQQARPTEDEAEPSSLIGKVRVVPIHRQNAVMILASPEYRDAVRGLVEDLDKPGRQVMIAAIIAEVQLNDDLALGVRFSDSPAVRTGELPDYRLGGFADFLGQATDVLSGLFDTSTLDVNTSVQVAIQALAQKTKLRVIQEPRVFTADNQEAAFFEGRDVPILTTSQVTDVGTVTESVEYVAIGVGLNVRPRITSHGDIDLEVNLKLSNIDPSGEILESPVFQRRETSTQIIVRNGQTVVISGILRDEESRIDRKVPLLGDVPLFGELFKSREYGTTRTELLAFITPVIVDNPTENDSNFNVPARQRLEDLVRPLKEQDIRELDPERVRQRLLHHQFGYGPPRVPEEG